MSADYKVTDEGIDLPTRTSDPENPTEGSIWHRVDLGEIHGFVGGVIGVILPKKKSELDDTDFAADIAEINQNLLEVKRAIADNFEGILKQLKIMNIHLLEGSDQEIDDNDLN